MHYEKEMNWTAYAFPVEINGKFVCTHSMRNCVGAHWKITTLEFAFNSTIYSTKLAHNCLDYFHKLSNMFHSTCVCNIRLVFCLKLHNVCPRLSQSANFGAFHHHSKVSQSLPKTHVAIKCGLRFVFPIGVQSNSYEDAVDCSLKS